MSSDPWDSLPSGDYFKFEEPGDAVVGDVIGIGIGEDFNGNPAPQVVVRQDDGQDVTVTAGQAQLKAKLMAARPKVGDRIKMEYTQKEQRAGGKTLKHFDVVVKEGGAKAPVTEEAVQAAEDDF